jgi:hypothetical protein
MSELNSALLWTIVLIPVVIALFWCFVIWLISIRSGWQRLAQKYRATQPASGKKWLSQYGFVNRSKYGNVLNLTTNETGIFLETMPLFGFNHPPLFIPWSDLHNPTPVTARWREFVQVDAGSPVVATLRLPPAVFTESEGRKI